MFRGFFFFFLMLTGFYAVLLGNTLDFWNLREQVLQIHKIIKPNISIYNKAVIIEELS